MSNKTKSPLSSTTKVAGLSLPMGETKSGDMLAPAPVYLLADHLDAVLASGEDLTQAHIVWDMSGREDMADILHHRTDVRAEIENIRALENAIIARVLKSRDRAAEVMRADKRFMALGKLYLAGTAVLLDAVEECGDCTAIDFDTADSIPAYLRSRGLVAADAPAPSDGDTLQVSDKFLIAKRIAVGPLMDLAGTFLDSLETHFDLFLDEDELPLPPLVERPDDRVAEADASDATPESPESAAIFAAQMADVRAALAEVDSNDDPLPRFMTSGDTAADAEQDAIASDDSEGLQAEPEIVAADEEASDTIHVASDSDDEVDLDLDAADDTDFAGDEPDLESASDIDDDQQLHKDSLEANDTTPDAAEAAKAVDIEENEADAGANDLAGLHAEDDNVDPDALIEMSDLNNLSEDTARDAASRDDDETRDQTTTDAKDELSALEVEDQTIETDDDTTEPEAESDDLSATDEDHDDEHVSAVESEEDNAEDEITAASDPGDDDEASNAIVNAETQEQDDPASETPGIEPVDGKTDHAVKADSDGDDSEATENDKPKSLIRRLRLVK
jgi:hypothetical protein